ncbi:MAG TPA: F0F1 ATP synthase subunit A [candidate division Zixibacteria bacterium]|nr:F0F1 ATP synthase subunit A [candidate division Zixibacteria bacterium]
MKLFKKDISLWLVIALGLVTAFALGGALVADETAGHADSSVVAQSTDHAADEAAAVSGEADEHAADEHATDEHAEGEHHEGGHELPNLIGIIFGHKTHPEITDIQYWENVIFAFLAGFFLVVIAQRVYAKRQMIPGRLQNAVEMLVEYFYDFFHSILGDNTKRFMPYLGTLFFYILTMNFMGLTPFFKAASSSINITASLALLTFLYAQYVGFQKLGFLGWLDHLAGEPRDAIGWAMVPRLLPIHIIGELAKPFSLAVRLFGNITGEDVLIFAFVGLGLSISHGLISESFPIGLPLQAIFIPLSMLFSTIQALVFTVLSTIYIALMIPHGDHH